MIWIVGWRSSAASAPLRKLLDRLLAGNVTIVQAVVLLGEGKLMTLAERLKLDASRQRPSVFEVRSV